MQPLRFVVFCVLACLPTGLMAGESTTKPDGGVLLGHDRFDGLMLLRELNCVACHAASDHPVLTARPAPRLSSVGSRLSPDYLRAFLAQPHVTKAGTPMPDVMAGLIATQKAAAVESLVNYLVSLGGPMDTAPQPIASQEIDAGKALYHSVGCVACHQAFIPPPSHPEDKTVVAPDDDDRRSGQQDCPHAAVDFSFGAGWRASFGADAGFGAQLARVLGDRGIPVTRLGEGRPACAAGVESSVRYTTSRARQAALRQLGMRRLSF